MKNRDDLKPATIAAQAAGAIDTASGGVVPPIRLSTTFVRDTSNQPLNPDNVYLRNHNDTARLAENILAKLENAQEALLFPSGMAAVAAVFRSVKTGGSVVVQTGTYWGAIKWIRDFTSRRQIRLFEVDCTDTAALNQACETHSPDLVFIETPSNPLLKIVDIRFAADCAHAAGALLVVDATAATPILSQPLEFGADIVMHSATKAINGHSDVLAGALATANKDHQVWQAITSDRNDAGAVIGPFEAWLLVRGMRTLPLRVERMSQNAQKLADFLLGHEAVEGVLYPGLPSHPGHTLAAQQMTGGFGCLLSVLIKGDAVDALRVTGKLNLFHRATSLGGVESLIEHRHTVEPDTGLPQNLLRISVGIEDVNDLIDDMAQALCR